MTEDAEREIEWTLYQALLDVGWCDEEETHRQAQELVPVVMRIVEDRCVELVRARDSARRDAEMTERMRLVATARAERAEAKLATRGTPLGLLGTGSESGEDEDYVPVGEPCREFDKWGECVVCGSEYAQVCRGPSSSKDVF